MKMTTMLLSLMAAALLAVADAQSCTNYMRMSGDKCGDACIGRKVGWCPSSIVVKFGKLKKGRCKYLCSII